MESFYEENKEFLPEESENVKPLKKKKIDVVSYLPSVFLTFALISLSALGSLMQFQFGLKDVVWSAFLISFALRMITIYLSRYVGSNLYYNKALDGEDVQSAKKDFITEGSDIDKADLEKYVQEYNVNSKKQAYTLKIKSKILALKHKVSVLRNKNELNFNEKREKEIATLLSKISLLESICTKDYVDKNIGYIKTKYIKLSSCFFLSHVEDSTEKNKQYNVSFAKENSAEIIRTLPLTVSIILLGSLISYDVIIGSANAVSIVYDVTTMIFSFIVGWFIIGKRIISRTINAYINRVIFISEYKQSLKSKEKTQKEESAKTEEQGVKNEEQTQESVGVVEKDSNQ